MPNILNDLEMTLDDFFLKKMKGERSGKHVGEALFPIEKYITVPPPMGT